MKRIRLLGLDFYGCQEALEKLDDYIDRELSVEEASKVAFHLRLCRECARKFHFEAEFIAGLGDKLRHITLPDEDLLHGKIAHALQEERQR